MFPTGIYLFISDWFGRSRGQGRHGQPLITFIGLYDEKSAEDLIHLQRWQLLAYFCKVHFNDETSPKIFRKKFPIALNI